MTDPQQAGMGAIRAESARGGKSGQDLQDKQDGKAEGRLRLPSRERETCLPGWYSLLGEFLANLAYEHNLTTATIEAYRRDVGQFCDLLVRRNVRHPDDITARMVTHEMKRLGEAGLALSTLGRKLSAIRSFLRYLRELGHSGRDLAAQLDSPRKGVSLPHVLSEASVKLLLEQGLRDSGIEGLRVRRAAHPAMLVRDTALLEFAYATGARVSEICTLRLQDLNLENGWCRLYGKGRKERLAPLHAAAIVALRRWLVNRDRLLHGRGQSAVFVSRTGAAMDRSAVFRLVQRAATAAGIAGPVGPHTLRHSVATHLLRRGMNLREVQELLGHENITTTQRYTHLTIEHLREVHRRCHPRR